jgi:succinate dehydrogenase / fumarate reductase cytochrome b subunit
MKLGTQPWRRILSLFGSSVGRKYVMALSGLAIFGFVVVHMVGTMKIFLGPESTNSYGEALRDLGGHLLPRTHLLWLFRIGLIGAFGVHLHVAFSLARS